MKLAQSHPGLRQCRDGIQSPRAHMSPGNRVYDVRAPHAGCALGRQSRLTGPPALSPCFQRHCLMQSILNSSASDTGFISGRAWTVCGGVERGLRRSWPAPAVSGHAVTCNLCESEALAAACKGSVVFLQQEGRVPRNSSGRERL